MAATAGFKAFDQDKEDWMSYSERLTHYFIATGITDASKQRSTLLSVCGPETYRLLRSLVGSAVEINAKSFEELVDTLKQHYVPTPSVIIQRYKFNSRNRNDTETILQFLAALRSLAEYCNYGTILEDMLRDRLVCGVRNKQIQKRLLAEKDLTFAKAKELAESMEAAAIGSKQIQEKSETPVQGVHYASPAATDVYQPRPFQGRGKVTCYRCNGNHFPSACRFKQLIYNKCKKIGHIAPACRSKKPADKGTTKHSHHVDEQYEVAEPEGAEYSMYNITHKKGDDPIYLDVTMNGIHVKMELDTGSGLTIINEQMYSKIAKPNQLNPLQKTDIILKTYTGEKIDILGSAQVVACYQGKEVVLPVQVVKGVGPNLLGRDWINQLKVSVGSRCNLLNSESNLDHLLGKHAELFKPELGTLKDFKAILYLKPDATPKFCRGRTVPFALKKPVEVALDSLVEQGIISPVKFSSWAAPIVPVMKQDGTVQLCGDYKVSINHALQVDSYPIPRVEHLFASMSGGKYFSKLDLSQAYLQIPLDDSSKELVTINTHKGLFRYNR